MILIIYLLSALILFAGGVLAWSTLINKPDIQLTDRVVVTGGDDVGDKGQVEIMIPGEPSARKKLALILRLENLKKVGDCVAPAGMDISLIGDGVARPKISGARSGEELELSLEGVAHTATVQVVVNTPDPDCKFGIHVDKAVLFN
jgi:hypothetical protein